VSATALKHCEKYPMHVYEVRPRKDHRGVDLRCRLGRLWHGEPNAASNAIDYAKHRSRSHDAMIRVYDEAGNVIETREQNHFSKSNRNVSFVRLQRRGR
jgi:hypothetical protein